jgi:regulator of protease activity HflC (stomatin/prohibitin superfamily)
VGFVDGLAKRIAIYGGALAVLYLFAGEFVLPEHLKGSTIVAEKTGETTAKHKRIAAVGEADARRELAEGEADAIVTESYGKSEAAAIEAEGQAQAKLTMAPAEAAFITETETARARVEAAKACEVTRLQTKQKVEAECLAQTGRYSECSVRAQLAATGHCDQYADILNQ